MAGANALVEEVHRAPTVVGSITGTHRAWTEDADGEKILHFARLVPVTDLIFGYDSAKPNIKIFGADSAAEYPAVDSVCFGSVKKIARIFGDASAGLQTPDSVGYR